MLRQQVFIVTVVDKLVISNRITPVEINGEVSGGKGGGKGFSGGRGGKGKGRGGYQNAGRGGGQKGGKGKSFNYNINSRACNLCNKTGHIAANCQHAKEFARMIARREANSNDEGYLPKRRKKTTMMATPASSV